MSLPSHLRTLVSSAADRVRRDRQAAHLAARSALRDRAKNQYQALTIEYDADVRVFANTDGFGIAWDDDGGGNDFGPLGSLGQQGLHVGPWRQWMETAFAVDGEHPARVLTSEGYNTAAKQWEVDYVKRWVWPTEAAARAALASFAGPARSAS